MAVWMRIAWLAMLSGSCGCGVSFYPSTADYTGQNAARASFDLHAEAMPEASDVVDVELTLDTVEIRRVFDGRAVLLAGDETRSTLIAEPRSQELDSVPVRMQAYDRIAFGVTAVRVATDTGWHDAALAVDEVVLDGEYTVDGDVTIGLSFDLRAGLRGDSATGFTFDPQVTVAVQPAP